MSSRQRRAILRRAEKLGIEVAKLEWEPISRGMEKCGPSGGWTLETDAGGLMFGYSYKDLMRDMTLYVQRKSHYGGCPHS
jgi:hypothetical protein